MLVDLSSGWEQCVNGACSPIAALPSPSWNQDPALASASIVEYRRTLAVDGPTALALTVTGAWELSVDGEVIARNGVIGEEYGNAAGHVVVLPAETHGAVALGVRVWTWRTTLPAGGQLYAAEAMDPGLVDLWTSAERGKALIELVPSLFSGFGLLTAGVLALGLSLRRPELPGVRAFGIGAIALGLQLVPQAMYYGFLPFSAWTRPMQFFGFAISHPALLQSASETFGGDRRVVLGIAALFAVRAFVVSFCSLPPWGMPLSILICFVPSAIALVWWVVRGLRTDVPGSRVIAVTSLGFLFAPALGLLAAAGLLPGPAVAALPILDIATSILLIVGMTWALTVERVLATIGELEEAYGASLRFVPTQFLERVGRRNVREVRRGDAVRERLTVMFLDIRGFTTLAEQHPPEFAFHLVNAMLDHVEPELRACGGFITSYTGDGFAAVFPTADGAVSAAIRTQATLDRLGRDGVTAVPIAAGIGLHTGDVILGTIGGGGYLTVSMVADAVNLAARVEGTAKLYGVRIVATSDTVDALHGRDGVRELDRVIAKGRKQPIGLFEVGSPPDAAFEAARSAYGAGRFAEAAARFRACAGYPPASILADRCDVLAAAPPAGWDGVWKLDAK
jgi:class 3 adenylate cyclase